MQSVAERAVVPLESGDRLTRDEFERRYACRPDVKKAELIDGVVYVASPVRLTQHGKPHALLITWLGTYAVRTAGTILADNATVRLEGDNEVQPDALLGWDEAHGGQARLSDDDYLAGAPELVAEVAASSAAYDLHDKLEVYRRNGVREYIAWQVLEGRIDWFMLEGGEYKLRTPGADGVIECSTFPGLRLDPAAMLAGDGARVLAALDRPIPDRED